MTGHRLVKIEKRVGGIGFVAHCECGWRMPVQHSTRRADAEGAHRIHLSGVRAQTPEYRGAGEPDDAA